jgi:ParB family chromosome partitioning protein
MKNSPTRSSTVSKGLGRGFGALLPGEDTFSVPDATLGDVVKIVPLALVEPNPDQPRKDFDPLSLQELADSIREQGVLQPLLVEGWASGYRIVAGERRWRAAQLAGLTEVPVLVRSFTEESRMEIALIENVQRTDLTPLEEARAYRNLMDAFNLTQDEVAKKVGKQRSTVANALRLLKLPEEMLAALDQGHFTPGHARAVLSVTLAEDQRTLFQAILSERLSVREAEDRAQRLNAGSPPRAPQPSPIPAARVLPEIADLERRFIERLGTRVTIKGNTQKGKIEIVYHSSADLDRLYEVLGGGET